MTHTHVRHQAFGRGFELGRTHVRPPRIPTGSLLFLHEVTELSPRGGPWGRGYLRAALLGAIAAVGLAQLGLGLAAAVAGGPPPVAVLGALLFVFFCGFNMLEASQPSLVSRLAPPAARGTALGIYNTTQSLGLFAGGAAGGLMVTHAGPAGLFAGAAALCVVWLAISWRLRVKP